MKKIIGTIFVVLMAISVLTFNIYAQDDNAPSDTDTTDTTTPNNIINVDETPVEEGQTVEGEGGLRLLGTNNNNNEQVFHINRGGDTGNVQFRKVETENWSNGLEISESAIGAGLTIYVKADNKDANEKPFWKWECKQGSITFASETNNQTTFEYHGGDVTVVALYKGSEEKTIKYYGQNIYANKDGTVVTEDPSLRYEKLENDAFEFKNNNKDRNKYNFDEMALFEYDNATIGNQLPLQSDDGHPAGENYWFNKASGDRLIRFYFVEKPDEGYYRIKLANKNAVAKVNGTAVTQAQPEDTVVIEATATIGDTEFNNWSVIANMQQIEVDNPYSNNSQFTMPSNDVTVNAIYKPKGATTCDFRFEQYIDGKLGENYNVSKIGGVTPISGNVNNPITINGEVYLLKRMVLTDDKNFTKEYSMSDLTEMGTVIGYYSLYENQAILPNGYEKLYYRAYYEKRAATSESVRSLLPNDFSALDTEEIVLNVNDGSVSSSEESSITEAAGTSGNLSPVIDKVFDLTLFVGYKEAGKDKSKQVTDLEGDGGFSIYLTDEELAMITDKTNILVGRIHNGKTEILKATLTGNRLDFSSDGFSTYAIVSFKDKSSGGGGSDTPSRKPTTSAYKIPKTGIE